MDSCSRLFFDLRAPSMPHNALVLHNASLRRMNLDTVLPFLNAAVGVNLP